MAKKSRAPWKQPNPRLSAGKQSRHLSPAKKASAKARARRAGRPYPNLVDNMRMAATAKKKTKKTTKKKTAKPRTGRAAGKRVAKKTTRKSARRRAAKHPAKPPSNRTASREKDPKGGLTAAGRKAFARQDGSHLKPGVRKKLADMTPQDMRRKGSWAVRFYGRKKLPPLVDKQGRPTRHALSAHAWGEPVPRTVAAARRIAARGERLLQRYRRTKGEA
jgi:hypothetical protein